MSGSHDTQEKMTEKITSIKNPITNKKIIVEDKGQNQVYDDQIAYDTYSTHNNTQHNRNNDSHTDPTLKITHGDPEFDLLQKNFATNLDQISSSQNITNKNPDALENQISRGEDLHHKAPNHNQTTNTSIHEKKDLPDSE